MNNTTKETRKESYKKIEFNNKCKIGIWTIRKRRIYSKRVSKKNVQHDRWRRKKINKNSRKTRNSTRLTELLKLNLVEVVNKNTMK